MAKTNYSFAKRQRELAKKQKKEEKRIRNAGDATELATSEPVPETDPADPQPPVDLGQDAATAR